MQKGFTLIETMVSLALLVFVILAGARLLGAALVQTRGAAVRFRLAEAFDYHRHYLTSLAWNAAELAAGTYSRRDREVRITWCVEQVDPALKRVRLQAAIGRLALSLPLNRSRFILEVLP